MSDKMCTFLSYPPLKSRTYCHHAFPHLSACAAVMWSRPSTSGCGSGTADRHYSVPLSQLGCMLNYSSSYSVLPWQLPSSRDRILITVWISATPDRSERRDKRDQPPRIDLKRSNTLPQNGNPLCDGWIRWGSCMRRTSLSKTQTFPAASAF